MAKVRASFNEKTGRWRWVPKVWHLTWSFSPSGSTYYITDLPGGHIRDISSPTENDAIAFTNVKVAEGFALALSARYGTTIITRQRWNGLPPSTNVLR